MTPKPAERLTHAEIQTVSDIVITLSVHYAVWAELTLLETSYEHRVTQLRYRDFIKASKMAHFNAFCSLTTKLCQRDRDVIGMDDIVSTMRKIDNPLANEIVDFREKLNPIVHRIRRARTRLFDHQELSETSRDLLSWINLEQIDLIAFVQACQLLMSKVVESVGLCTGNDFFDEVETAELRAAQDVRRVFDVLAERRK